MPNAVRATCSRRSSNEEQLRSAAARVCETETEGVWSLLNNVFCWQQTSKIKCVFLFFQLFSHLASGPADWPFRAAAVTGHIGVTILPSSSSAAGSLTLMHTNWVSHTVDVQETQRAELLIPDDSVLAGLRESDDSHFIAHFFGRSRGGVCQISSLLEVCVKILLWK